jgi:hypothetical protein
MQLDHITKFNEHGDELLRLYDFKMQEAILFTEAVRTALIENGTSLKLDDLEFVEPRNCSLTLKLGDESLGIVRERGRSFVCTLPVEGYENMLRLIAPFCLKDRRSHQYLYELDTLTDLLFSPSGTW